MLRSGIAIWLGVVTASPATATARPRAPQPPEARALRVIRENCLGCHGERRASGLDLRSRMAAIRGGAHGAVIAPGSPERSRLFRLVTGREKLRMPPGRPLPRQDTEAIRAWIAAGARWGSVSSIAIQRPWPFNVVPRTTALPAVRNKGWAHNPIDRFILAGLEARGIKPAPPANRAALLRRAYLDMVGTPPTPAEIDAFTSDRSPSAWVRVVDRLLASPHYGERWARHWLDLARYAESEGFKTDEMRPNAWRYRDYVIQSLNGDKPYDRFIREQIAGDELYPNDPQALVATGFCRHWPDESNARNLLQRRQEILNDITDTVGSSILGLTWGCARCHDHKFDPIPQTDYYRLQAFFAAVRPRDDIPLISPSDRPAYERRLAAWEAETGAIRAEIAAIENPIQQRLARVNFVKFPAEVQTAITKPACERTAIDWFLFHKAEPYFRVSAADTEKQMPKDVRARWQALKQRLSTFQPDYPGDVPAAIGITDLGREAPKTYALAVGVYNAYRQEVQPGFPTLCGGGAARISPIATPESSSTGRRRALAEWLTSRSNPLTARVMVNRVWQYHFGRGIVATPSDFGSTGEKPTHPELLDWLAGRFMATAPARTAGRPSRFDAGMGWSLKALHRLILTSAAYCQSTQFDARAAARDPDNRLLWRFRRQRLEGEVIRDSILAVSGELNPRMGGPSIMPELPAGLTTRGYWKETADPAERSRRSIYVFVKRNLRYPLFEVFDMPDTHEPCARRQVTTTAPQALALLNNETALRAARRFAARVLAGSSSSPAEQVSAAYRMAFGRPPRRDESESAVRFLKRQAALPLSSASPSSSLEPTSAGDPASPLEDLCLALLNASEFIYVE